MDSDPDEHLRKQVAMAWFWLRPGEQFIDGPSADRLMASIYYEKASDAAENGWRILEGRER